MRIALASDHAGFALEDHVRDALAAAGHDDAGAIAQTFLSTDFDGGRHARRVGQISELERA